VQLNGKKCNIPSAMVKIGDIISLKEKSHQIPMVIEGIASPERDVPDYCDVDHKKNVRITYKNSFIRGCSLCCTNGAKSSC
jgi:ribosomal protein S4